MLPPVPLHTLINSVDGSFDDCQAIVKGAFADAVFRDGVSLGAVNSINWARVLAQTTYYFWAYFRVTDIQVYMWLSTLRKFLHERTFVSVIVVV
jgi:threonine synthase